MLGDGIWDPKHGEVQVGPPRGTEIHGTVIQDPEYNAG